MPLARGTRRGPYEILGPIGAGGMGEVWRARDTRLAREVALKVIPDHLSDDPKALARFENEAKAVAALSHPHILAIHDVGRSDGTSYVVTELLEGETLRAPLLRGPLPLRKALDVAAQLADALAAAHEKGIVHRDVKPENVILTKDGRAKLLDFGLARHDATFRSDDDSRSPTVTRNTDPGAVVGTISYMSPEQARGHPVGFGSDQFSLGVVLYEMLSGKRPFHGPSSAETLTAIIRAEPEPLRAAVPAPVRWILDRLLAKDAADRYAATRDLARDLENCRLHVSGATGVRPSPPLKTSGARRVLVFWAGGVLVALGLAASFFLGRGTAAPPSPVLTKLSFGKGNVTAARFTPDGYSVVYSARWEGHKGQLFSARIDAPAAAVPLQPGGAVPVAVSRGELALLAPPASSDEGWVARADTAPRGWNLATVAIGGGTARPVVEGVLAADWSRDGTAFAVVRSAAGRSRLEYPPGKVLFETSGRVGSPRISPEGARVAFSHWPLTGSIEGDVLVVDGTGGLTTLSSGWGAVSGVGWSPDGREVWFTAGEIWGWQSLWSAAPGRPPRSLLKAPSNLSLLAVHEDGRALVVSGTLTNETWGKGPQDTAERLYAWLDGTGAFGLSADGTRLLFTEVGPGGGSARSVYLRRLDGSAPFRIGNGRARGLSPDGAWALATIRVPETALRLIPTGPGETRTLPRGTIAGYHWASFFPDGRRILVVGHEAGRPMRLFVQDRDGGPPRPLSPEGLRVPEPSAPVSPDEKLVAALPESGSSAPVFVEVAGGAVRPIEGLGPGDIPLSWTRDGRSLFVAEGTGTEPVRRVVRFEVGTRIRTPWKELRPAEDAGAGIVYQPVLANNGEVWFYTVIRNLNNLYLVEGLR